MRAVGVIQTDPGVDSAAAVASAAGTPTYLLRADGETGRVPPGVELLPVAGDDRVAAARRLRARCPSGRIVVLHAEESLSSELASELQRSPDTPALARSYRAPVRVHLFGRHFVTSPIVLAWDGDPDAAGTIVDCQGSVVVRFADLQHAITLLDHQARRAAAQRDRVAVGDFLWRPAWAFVRRAWLRRHDGVAGFILSVLETYGEVLTAGKVCEKAGTFRSRSIMIPATFRHRETPGGTIAIRDDIGPELERIVVRATPEHVEGGDLLPAGRGATWALRIAGAPPAMMRWYRRGGVPSWIARDTFIASRTPRPLRELAVTEQARARGIPVPEVLAVRVDRIGVGRYRGAIVTREIEGAVGLGELLVSASAPLRETLLQTTARVIRCMHDRGLHHPDLNASNVLLVRRGNAFDAFIIDLDRARLGASVSSTQRRRTLRRLDRSLVRLAGLDADMRATLHRTYWATG